MKKTLCSGIALAIVFLLSNTAYATVGGPTLIDTIQYSNDDHSKIIFEQQNYSGKGCPPEIFLMSIGSGAITPLVSCNDADWDNQNAYNARLERTLASYPALMRHIDLKKNNITVAVDTISETIPFPDEGVLGGAKFRLTVYQNGTEKGSFMYTGCNPGQTHVIEGYTIPYSTNLTLLVSSVGDCFEGGYAKETLHVIQNVSIKELAPLPQKGPKPASPDTGNISIVATNNLPGSHSPVSQPTPTQTMFPSPIPTNTSATNDTYFFLIIGALVVIILLLIVRRK